MWYFDSYIEEYAAQTGINTYLVKSIGILLFFPWLIGIGLAIKFWNHQDRLKGIGILVVIASFYNLALYFGTKNNYRGKCFANTPDGLKIYECTDDMVDPVNGLPLARITPENLVLVINSVEGCNRVNPQNIDFFNKPTGKAQIWYYRSPNGNYDFFDGKCYHPKIGVPLKPVTREVVNDWEKNRKTSLHDTEYGKSGNTDVIDTRKSDTKINQSSSSISGNRINENELVQTVNSQKYVNSLALSRIGGYGKITIIAGEKTNQFDFSLTENLRKRGVNAETNILKPVFFETKFVDKLKEGDPILLRNLGLSQYNGHLFFYHFSFGEPIINELYVIRAYFTVRLVPINGGRIIRRKFNARGSGFTEMAAKKQAEKRVLEDLINSTIFEKVK